MNCYFALCVRVTDSFVWITAQNQSYKYSGSLWWLYDKNGLTKKQLIV